MHELPIKVASFIMHIDNLHALDPLAKERQGTYSFRINSGRVLINDDDDNIAPVASSFLFIHIVYISAV